MFGNGGKNNSFYLENPQYYSKLKNIFDCNKKKNKDNLATIFANYAKNIPGANH